VSLYGFEHQPPVLRKVRGDGYRPQFIRAPPSWLSGLTAPENGRQPHGASLYNCPAAGPRPGGELEGDRLVCEMM
jgi:hypothetical protein